MLCANPHQIEAPANITTLARNAFFRPYRSPRDPPTSSNAAKNSAYASTTHCKSLPLAWKNCCSAGNAIFTTVPSMKAMLDPAMVAANTHAPARLSGISVQEECCDRRTASSQGVRQKLLKTASFATAPFIDSVRATWIRRCLFARHSFRAKIANRRRSILTT